MRIAGTLHRVSTLFTQVGVYPTHRRSLPGKGGLNAGSYHGPPGVNQRGLFTADITPLHRCVHEQLSVKPGAENVLLLYCFSVVSAIARRRFFRRLMYSSPRRKMWEPRYAFSERAETNMPSAPAGGSCSISDGLYRYPAPFHPAVLHTAGNGCSADSSFGIIRLHFRTGDSLRRRGLSDPTLSPH